MNFIKVSCLIAQTKRCRSRAVKWRQRNIQKSVMQVLSYCFANLIKSINFLSFLSPSPPSLLKLPPIFHESPLVQWQSTKMSSKQSILIIRQALKFTSH